jgi:TRAP-type C4-dicarboxylate transport system permease small subunit
MPGPKLNFLERAFRPLEVLLALSIVAVFIEVLTEVAFRYLLHLPVPWGAEVSQTLLVWITFLGAALALFRGEHMAINLLLDRISSARVRKTFEIAGDLAILAFLVIGIFGGYQVVVRTWSMQTTALQIPAGILYLAFPLGCLIMVPVVIRNLYLKVRKE